MNTGKSREENFDPDFERRILISRLALSVLLTLTSIWTAVFFNLKRFSQCSNLWEPVAALCAFSFAFSIGLLTFCAGFLAVYRLYSNFCMHRVWATIYRS